MRPWAALGGIALLLTATVSATTQTEAPERPAATAPAPEPGVEPSVRAFLAHYLRVLEAQDEEATRALYVADERFTWFTDGALSYRSADDVLDGMRRYRGVRFATTPSDVRVIELTPELASASFAFETRLTIPGADDHVYGGIVTLLLERASPTAEWRVVVGHTSTPGGPPRGGEQR